MAVHVGRLACFTPLWALSVVGVSVMLGGCGNEATEPIPPDPTEKTCEEDPTQAECELPPDLEGFDEEPVRLSLDFSHGDTQICYAIRRDAVVDCLDDPLAWDLMFEQKGRSWLIWTNGVVNGVGNGASFGPLLTAEADTIQSKDVVPGWFSDSIGGVFLSAPWQSYNVLGNHDITANQRVYVVSTPDNDFRVQLLSYYNDQGASGHIQLRYGRLDDDPSMATTRAIDARAGGFGAPADHPDNKYVYLDLDTDTILALTDAEAQSNTAWDLAFKRYDVRTNSGDAGPGATKAAVAVANDDLYDANGPIRSAFEALDAASADAAFASVTSKSGLSFVTDRGVPYVSANGMSPTSWFKVTPPPVGPAFDAQPDVWWYVRGAKGDAFAKYHVVNIDYVLGARTVIDVELFRQVVAAPEE